MRSRYRRIGKTVLAVWILLVTLPMPIVHRHDTDEQLTNQQAIHLELRHDLAESTENDWHVHWLWLSQIADECSSGDDERQSSPEPDTEIQAWVVSSNGPVQHSASESNAYRIEVGAADSLATTAVPVYTGDLFLQPPRALLAQFSILRC